MKKAVLKERLQEAKHIRVLHDEEMKAMSKRVADLENALRDAMDVPPDDHTEALIACRVELALCHERGVHQHDVERARKQVIREIQGDLKMRILESGTSNEWLEFSKWLEEWRVETYK